MMKNCFLVFVVVVCSWAFVQGWKKYELALKNIGYFEDLKYGDALLVISLFLFLTAIGSVFLIAGFIVQKVFGE